MAVSNGKRYFTYESRNAKGDYSMVKTSDGKILTFTDKDSLVMFAKEKSNGLLRILDLTEDIQIGNISLNRLEILN
jgi:hypothetical protein